MRTTTRTTGDVASAAQTYTTTSPMRNHLTPKYVALHPEEAERRERELQSLLRQAVRATARKCLTDIPYTQRSGAETQFLQDCARGRRVASDATLAKLLMLEARAASPFTFSEEIRALEARLAPVVPMDVLEASELEQQAQGPLDLAQLLAAKEQTAVRWTQVWELARQHYYALRRLADAACVRAFGKVA